MSENRGTPLDDYGQPLIRAFNTARLYDRCLDELIGMAKMSIADGVVTQQEAEFILRWMTENSGVANKWPGDILYSRLVAALGDGFLDAEEQRELFELMQDMTGQRLQELGAVNQSTRLPLDIPPPRIKFSGSLFCLTGRFFYGTRRCCQDAITALGGVPIETIRLDLDYLVIGELGSTDWIHSAFGRKIEKALEYREKKKRPVVVSEEHWVKCLQVNL